MWVRRWVGKKLPWKKTMFMCRSLRSESDRMPASMYGVNLCLGCQFSWLYPSVYCASQKQNIYIFVWWLDSNREKTTKVVIGENWWEEKRGMEQFFIGINQNDRVRTHADGIHSQSCWLRIFFGQCTAELGWGGWVVLMGIGADLLTFTDLYYVLPHWETMSPNIHLTSHHIHIYLYWGGWFDQTGANKKWLPGIPG